MNKIEVIKGLRDKGAGVRMLDDVADYVGGYDSPLFIPTIEFMLKMRIALGIEKGPKEQSVGVDMGGQEQIPEKYDPDYFKNVSLEAAHDCAPSIENIESQQMNEMQNYLSDMIEQENMHMLQLEREVAINLEKSKTSNKVQEKKMEGQQKKAEKEAVIQQVADNAKEKSQDSNPNSSKNKKNVNQQAMLANQGQGQRNAGQQEKKPITIRKSMMSLLNTYLTKAEKRDLKNLAGVTKGKDVEKIEVAVIQQTTQQAQQQVQQQQQQDPEKSSESKRSSRKNKNNMMDSLLSGMIDKIVKSSKENKPDILAKPDEKALQAAKDSESTKYRDQVGKDNTPRADDKKVAEMSAKDAIDKLRESGVKPIVQDAVTPSVKDVMDKQTQEQLKKNDQVQR
jgi:hypothetical protein